MENEYSRKALLSMLENEIACECRKWIVAVYRFDTQGRATKAFDD